MKCALITAGGCGTRLYPLSTKDCPKQFVKMFDNKTLIELTYERVNKFIDKENIFIVLPLKYKHFINELLPFVKDENIIIEPSQMSTSPCVLYSCLYINKIRKNSYLYVFPADHYIENNNEFVSCLEKSYDYLKENNTLVLLGIKPSSPSGRYGYLKAKGKTNICKISGFKEKPNKFIALMYFISKKYFWSLDIYGFKISYMIDLYKKYNNKDYLLLTKKRNIIKAYEQCDKLNVAKSIFEKVDNISMIKCNFNVEDVGVFESLLKYTNNQNVIDAYNMRKNIF